MFDLVIFDCDGVLIDSEIISAQMLIDVLAQRGVQIDLAYVARHFLGRSYPTVMETIRQEFHLILPPDFEADYRAKLLERFERDLKIMPGVAEVIAQMGVAYCIATSSSPMRAAKSLQMVGLGHLAGDHLFTSTLVGARQTCAGFVPLCGATDGGRSCALSGDRRQPDRHPCGACRGDAGLALYGRQPSERSGAGRTRRRPPT